MPSWSPFPGLRRMLLLLLLVPGLLALGWPKNPWLERRVLNIAHQGGRLEAPSNTLFALKTAKQKGADVVEIDVHATKDRRLVVVHDTTVDHTTNGTGRVADLSLAEIKDLDAAYWFVEGCGACHQGCAEADYVYRGIATGDRDPPQGFGANDFTIPTLDEVLTAFPDTFVNIEIKVTAPEVEPYEHLVAAALQRHGRVDDVIVVSFDSQAIEAFKLHAAEVHTATATAETALFTASAQGPLPGAPNPRHVALQVPIAYQDVPVVTQDFVEDAHANGLAVHVWTVNDPEEMGWLIGIGVDGIMTDVPTVLEEVLAGDPTPSRRGSARPWRWRRSALAGSA